MSNKTYDILKYIAQIVLPAAATLYGALAGIWGFPYGEQVVSTISAVDLFLGAILKINSDAYYKAGKDTAGTLAINSADETFNFSFGDMTAEELADMKQVKVKIENYEGKHEAE